MRFLYKIYSGFDGFTPRRLPTRLDTHGRLVLGWRQYIDVVEPGAEVWVYFHGPHAFSPGVYARGFADEIAPREERVYLRLREHATDVPLTDDTTNAQVAYAVAQRGRQVFFLPQTLLPPVADCTPEACRARHCDQCRRWHQLPLIEGSDMRWPSRLPTLLAGFIPAYWVVPNRCFLYREGRGALATPVRAASDFFYRFKTGEERLAYPLAKGIYDALSKRRMLSFDAVVPVPLSPDKLSAGEMHRTLALSRELARLLGVRPADILSLRGPISKRRLRNDGLSAPAFERKYAALLDVDASIARYARVLLVDDVCDHGSTLRCTAEALRHARPGLELFAAAAGQMIIKEAVSNRARLVAA